MRGMRWKTWLVLLAVFALVATACSGEVSEDTGDEIITGSDDSTSDDDGGDGSGEDDGTDEAMDVAAQTRRPLPTEGPRGALRPDEQGWPIARLPR